MKDEPNIPEFQDKSIVAMSHYEKAQMDYTKLVNERIPEPYWCKTAPNVPRFYSASSLGILSECPRKFQYSYVEGWTRGTDNLDFEFGIHMHRCLEHYWRLRVKDQSGQAYDQDYALDQAVSLAMVLGLKLPQPTRPNQAGKTRKGLVNCIIWYVDKWKDQDTPEEIVMFKDKPAIEMHFEIMLPLVNPDGEPYIVQGYVDQIKDWSYGKAVWDFKSTGSEPNDHFMAQFDLSLQCAIYIIGMKVLTNEPISMFMADVVGVETRVKSLPEMIPVAFFNRKPVSLTEGELDEHLKDIQVLIKNNERYAEQNYWPKNTKACRFCDFKPICSKSPEIRPAFLETEFKRERRTFLKARKE